MSWASWCQCSPTFCSPNRSPFSGWPNRYLAVVHTTLSLVLWSPQAPVTQSTTIDWTSLAVHWLRIHVPTTGGTGLIPSQGTEAQQCDQTPKSKQRAWFFTYLGWDAAWVSSCASADQCPPLLACSVQGLLLSLGGLAFNPFPVGSGDSELDGGNKEQFLLSLAQSHGQPHSHGFKKNSRFSFPTSVSVFSFSWCLWPPFSGAICVFSHST